MSLKQTITNFWLRLKTGWSLMRLVRFLLAIAMFVEAYRTHDWLYIPLGMFLLWQAVFNTGCCTVYNARSVTNESQEVTYEEIK